MVGPWMMTKALQERHLSSFFDQTEICLVKWATKSPGLDFGQCQVSY